MTTKNEIKHLDGRRLSQSHCSEFLDGLVFASQFMAIDHHEGGFAEDILRASGYSQPELLAAQKRSGYETRAMNKIIRQAVPISSPNAGA